MRGRALVAVGVVALGLALASLWRRAQPGPDSDGRPRMAPTAVGAFTRGAASPREARVAGRVSTAQGAPLGAATVCAAIEDSEAMSAGPACATSGPDGAYAVLGLTAGRYAVTASAPGFRPGRFRAGERAWLELAERERVAGVDLVLAPGGALAHGRVLDLGGGAVAGALVTVHSARATTDAAAAITRSDDRGVWSASADAGEVVAIAAASGYSDGSARGLCPDNDIAVVLTPESVLFGRVLEARSRQPIAGAQVTAQAEPAGDDDTGARGSAGASSGTDGQFRIDRLPPGRYVVTATAPALRGQAAESVRLGLGETSREVVVAMHPAVPVTGKIVVGDAGVPCATGLVTLVDRRRSRRFEGRSRASGDVLIAGVLPGRYDVTASCEDSDQSSEQPPLLIERTPPPPLTFRVPAGGQAIAGTVVTDDGTPAVGVEVCASLTDEATHDFKCKETRSDGSFRIPNLAAGVFEVRARGGELAPAAEILRVQLHTGQDEVGVRLVVPTGAGIDGIVVSDDGTPVPGAVVMVIGPRGSQVETRTRDDGGFVVKGLRPGAHRVQAGRSWDELASGSPGVPQGQAVEVQGGRAARVKVVIAAARGRITGFVMEAGRPVGDAFVTAAREEGGPAEGDAPAVAWSWSRLPAVTDADGAFTLDGLVAGRYRVRAYRKGGGEAAVGGVAPGGVVTLVLRPQGAIAGIVSTAAGPAEDFAIAVEDREAGVGRVETFLHTGGAWIVRDLPSGRFVVSATAPEGTGRAEIMLGEGQRRDDVRIELAARATLRGQVVELESNRPWPGAEVSAQLTPAGTRDSAGELPGARADSDGRFELTDVPTSRLWLRARAPDRAGGPPAEGGLSVLVGPGAVQQLPPLRLVRSSLKPGERPGYLGFSSTAVGSPDVLTGWLVSSVDVDGPAADRLRVGDTIVAVAGHRVIGADFELYHRLLANVPAGTAVALTLARGVAVAVTAASWPSM
jgi:hypothetical protein